MSPNLNFIDRQRQNSTHEKRTPPEGSDISIFTSCSKIMLPVKKSAHMWGLRSSKEDTQVTRQAIIGTDEGHFTFQQVFNLKTKPGEVVRANDVDLCPQVSG